MTSKTVIVLGFLLSTGMAQAQGGPPNAECTLTSPDRYGKVMPYHGDPAPALNATCRIGLDNGYISRTSSGIGIHVNSRCTVVVSGHKLTVPYETKGEPVLKAPCLVGNVKGIISETAAKPGVKLGTAPEQGGNTVSSCPGQPALPVTFEIDCSHLKDAATRQACGPFIHNQACKVFGAYREITGIHLEGLCKTIKFNIYDDETWPHPKGEGGLALNCAVDYLAQYSVKFRPDSPIGPYDVHELLHEYQFVLGALPNMHILFGSSMAEAMRQVGDTTEYERRLKNLKEEAQRLKDDLDKGSVKPADQCLAAMTQVEESLYVENSSNVYLFYRKLVRSREASQADREARFGLMFYEVSGKKDSVKQFLIGHGCAKF